MYINGKIDMLEFFQRIQRCEGTVEFCTQEGDCLNLRSTLSKYLFVTLGENEALMQSGRLICSHESDYQLLAEFLKN